MMDKQKIATEVYARACLNSMFRKHRLIGVIDENGEPEIFYAESSRDQSLSYFIDNCKWLYSQVKLYFKGGMHK